MGAGQPQVCDCQTDRRTIHTLVQKASTKSLLCVEPCARQGGDTSQMSSGPPLKRPQVTDGPFVQACT